jgi:replicative DNA helicase
MDVLPSNIEAEEAVLGALLIDPDKVLALQPILTPEMFHVHRHALVYAAIMDLDAQGKPADLVVITDYLEQKGQLDDIGGPAFLTGLIHATPTSIHAEYYADIIARTYTLRRLIAAAGEIAKMAYQDADGDVEAILARAESLIYKIRAGASNGVQSAAEAADELWAQMERQIANPNFIPGWYTGIANLDRLLGYLDPGRQIIIAGRPGLGKTASALWIAHDMAVRRREPCMIFSYEMGNTELLQRLVELQTGLTKDKLQQPARMSPDEIRQVQEALAAITAAPLYFGPKVDANGIRSIAKRQSALCYQQWGRPLSAIFVDYLQIVPVHRSSKSETRDQEIGEMTRGFKNLATELECLIFVLSQLNRGVEQLSDKRPNMAHLRESGNIEADADVIMFTFPPAQYMSEQQRQQTLVRYQQGWEPLTYIVAKWRNGATGDVDCMWNRATNDIRSVVRQ